MILDLFAGPGGWDTGCSLLGRRDVIGVDWDAAACDTGRAAGHARVMTDVAMMPLGMWGRRYAAMLASPPCQGFSKAGKGNGRRIDAAMLIDAALTMGDGSDPRDWLREHMTDSRSVYALDPLRCAVGAWLNDRPLRWLAWEQVPSVLPLWEACGQVLADLGYDVEVEVVRAEQYGVPQTRRRAILRASLDGVRPLVPTHSRYYEQDPTRLDDDVPRWVSMAEALGWGMTQRPYPTIATGTARGGTDPMAIGGSFARNIIHAAHDGGAWVDKAYDDRPGAPTRWPDVEPVAMGDVRTSHGAIRTLDEPAPTMTASMDNGNFRWVMADDAREAVAAKALARLSNQSGNDYDMSWPLDRPSPTVAGRGLVTMPGANANRFNGATKSRNDGLRVTVAEAGILQTFPVDYPWRGTQTAQYRQVGDAVPPLLAAAILDTLVER